MPRFLFALLFAPFLAPPAAFAQDDPALELEKARGYFAEGQYDECLLVLGHLEDEASVATEAARLRIRALRTVGRYEEASEVAGRLVAADAEDLGARLELVLAARTLGKDEDAAAEIARMLQIDPENPAALANQGILAFETGRVKEAMTLFESARDRFVMADLTSATDVYWAGVAGRYFGMRTERESRTEALSLLTESVFKKAAQLDPTLYEAWYQRGMIWVDAYDAPFAKENFTEALQKNPRHPDLLAGMAATMLLNFGTRPEAVAYLQKALAVNPRHSEALALLAAVQLDDEEFVETKPLLDRALAVNPTDQRALALLAGYWWLHGDPAAYEAIEKKVLALNPACGDFYYSVAQVILTKRQFHRAVDLLKKAVELDPQHWHAYIDLGTNMMRIGVNGEEAARPYLEKAMREFPYHTQSKNMLELLKTYDEYVVRPHGDVHVRLHVSEDPLMRPYLERFLDECIPYLEKRYGVELPKPVLFEVFHEHDDFGVRSIGLTGLGALGVCFGQVVTMDGPAARKGEFNWKSTAWHEFAHVITLERSKYRIPRWFTEGLSGLEEKRANESWLREQNLELYSAYSSGRMRGIGELNAGFTRPKYGNEVIVCYYQAALVCEYIEDVHGWEKVLAMIDAFANRRTTEEAIQEVLGLDVAGFDEGFRRFAEERYFGAMRVMPTVTRDDIEDLLDRIDIDEKDADAYAKLGTAYFQQGKRADAEAKAGQALRLDPNLPAPYLILGRLLHAKGRPAQAREFLEKSFALGGEDYQGRLVLGSIYKDVEKDVDKAVAQFRKAKAAFPRNVDGSNPYLAIAEIELDRGNKPAAIEELTAYLRLNGEDHDHRVQLGQLLVEAGHPEQAIRWLRESIETKIQQPAAHQLLADVERQLGHLDEALFEYRALLEVSEEAARGPVYVAMGEVWLEKGDPTRARQMADEALALQPDLESARQLIEEIARRR